MTKRAQIIDAFRSMDTDALKVLLDDFRSYQRIDKDNFIHELGKLFKNFKAEGDSELLVYPGTCAHEECHNKGLRGVSFSGNKSNLTIAFIFAGTETEVTDIYYCTIMARDDASATWDSEEIFFV